MGTTHPLHMAATDAKIRKSLAAWLRARQAFEPHAQVLERSLDAYLHGKGPLPYAEMEAAEASRIAVAQSFHALCDAVRERGGP
jgi:hypothetical protein